MVSPGPHVHCSSPVVTFVCVTNESLHMHSELPLVPSVPLLSAHVTQSSELVEPVYLCERAKSLVCIIRATPPPARTYFPASQFLQLDAATPLYLPASHAVHVVLSADANLPGVQASQYPIPGSLLTKPLVQSSQPSRDWAPEVENLPAGQAKQSISSRS
jgi:hypothetical protein